MQLLLLHVTIIALASVLAAAGPSDNSTRNITREALEAYDKFDKLFWPAYDIDTEIVKGQDNLPELVRQHYVQYGFMLPTWEALGYIRSIQRPIVEGHSGLGVVAVSLANIGMDVDAVDSNPIEYSKYFWHKEGSYQGPPAPYYPTKNELLEDYLQTHKGAPGKALLLLNPTYDIYDFEWTDFKGDAVIFMQRGEGQDRLRKVLDDTGDWAYANHTVIDQYPMFKQGPLYGLRAFIKGARIDTYVRKSRQPAAPLQYTIAVSSSVMPNRVRRTTLVRDWIQQLIKRIKITIRKWVDKFRKSAQQTDKMT